MAIVTHACPVVSGVAVHDVEYRVNRLSNTAWPTRKKFNSANGIDTVYLSSGLNEDYASPEQTRPEK